MIGIIYFKYFLQKSEIFTYFLKWIDKLMQEWYWYLIDDWAKNEEKIDLLKSENIA